MPARQLNGATTKFIHPHIWTYAATHVCSETCTYVCMYEGVKLYASLRQNYEVNWDQLLKKFYSVL